MTRTSVLTLCVLPETADSASTPRTPHSSFDTSSDRDRGVQPDRKNHSFRTRPRPLRFCGRSCMTSSSRKRTMRRRTRRSQIGTGDRSEKIRTYNFPQGRVTDHRIKLTLYKLDAVMNGDIDELLDSLIAADQAAKLANLQEN